MSGRLPDSEYRARPWRIHEIAPDFVLEDVWELPWRGAADDFPHLVEMIVASDPAERSPAPVRLLWALRWWLGRALGWDGEASGTGARVASLRDRLPPGLPAGPRFAALPFETLYLLDDEFAAEIANRTMHGVLHLGRVPDGEEGFRAQMAVLVKPNGLLGRAYMAAIRPFRHLIVYPAMMREGERRWGARQAGAAHP